MNFKNRYENRTFQHEEITLDDSEFIDCIFGERTVIHYSGGLVSMSRGGIAGEIAFQFHGPALATVQLLAMLGSAPQGPALIKHILDSVQHHPSPPGA